MGGSSSKSNIHQEFNNLVVNKNDINILNEQINEIQVNTVMKEAQTCSASIVQDQNLKFKGIKSKGKLKFDLSQKQHSNLTFSCINASKARNDIANSMAQKIMGSLETSTSTEVLNKLGAIAATKAKSGSIAVPWGGSDSENNLTQIVNSTNITDNKKNIQNIVKNAIENTFTVDNVKSCINTVSNAQSMSFENIEGEEIDFIIDQDQSARLLADCVNQSDVSQKLTSGLTQFFEIKTKDDTTTKMKSQAEAEATAETSRKGMFEELGEGIGSMFKGMGEGLGNIAGGIMGALGLGAFAGMIPALGPISGSSSSSSCMLIICVIIFFVLSRMGGGSSEGDDMSTYE